MPDPANHPVPRCPGISTKEILAQDRNRPPPLLGEGTVDFLGDDDLPLDAYLSADFHRNELDKVWSRCWQMAARSETVKKAGAQIVYDIGDQSAVIVRAQDGKLRAFVNSCPHRGTRFADGENRALTLRCPFHGLTWALDGTVDHWPCAWDFRHVEPSNFNLSEIQLGEWGGFVFVNFDRNAAPLTDYLEDLPEHFARWPLEQRYTAAHVGKVMHCNWKIALEAFLETFHAVGLHPESLPFFGDANSQYDVWAGRRHYSRMINPSGVMSPHLRGDRSDARIVAAAARFGLCAGHPLAPSETPRQRIAQSLRAYYTQQQGLDLSTYSDSETIDVIEYNLFPNLIVFGGLGSPLAYRARPFEHDPHRCLFEVWLLVPFPEGTAPPEPAPYRFLTANERFGDVEALRYYGPVIDQDADAMGLVQRGMRASVKGKTTLGNYQELRIRHMRQTLADYLARVD